MPDYRIRPASIDDVEVLAHHRIAMFREMGTPLDAGAVGPAFRRWAGAMMPAGVFHAWLVDASSGEVAAGGGITVLPWPPGPRALDGRIAFVYNVYTEPPHRRRGLARMVMESIHAWCRDAGIGSAALNSSVAGQPLYESLGYRIRTNPMMICELDHPRAPSP